MKKPEYRKGYTNISNDLMDNICKLPLNGTDIKVILCIFRYTAGVGRKSCKLSGSSIAKWGNCDLRAVKRALKKLQENKIIIRVNPNIKGKAAEIMINKDYKQWSISKMKECVEFIGIFSNGSERSRLCAEKYNVNLYTSIDKIPEDIDIVFIAVRTGVMGGDGSELALKFLSKGIHVFIEQPIHIDEMKKCVKCSIEKGVFFHVANFYKYMDTVHKYIECSKGLLRKNEILSIECACANQVIYSLLDNILRIFREKARFSIENFWIQNQDFFIASGSINDIPLSIKVYNSVNTVDSDSYCYYLQQINIYTSEGMLFMVDVNGPIIWKPQFRAAHDLFIKKGDELDQRIFDSKQHAYFKIQKTSMDCGHENMLY